MTYVMGRSITLWSVAGLLAGCGPGAAGETGGDSTGDSASESSAADTGPSTGIPGTTSPTDSSATELTNPTDSSVTDPTSPTEATGGVDTDGQTDTSDTSWMPDPDLPQFPCEDALWNYVDPAPSVPAHARVDSRGHLRVTSTWSVLDFDAGGNLVGQIDPAPPWGWGGIDAADNLYVSFRDEVAGRKGLRKFDVAGALLWEIDRGPAPDIDDFAGHVTVAPDGTTLVSDEQLDRVERYDAAGAVVWDQEIVDKPFTEVFAMNAAGVAVAVRHGPQGAVLALAPDASVLWEHPFPSDPSALADIDEQGNVTVVNRNTPTTRLERLGPDGSVLAFVDIETPDIVGNRVQALAANEAGQSVLASTGLLNGEPITLVMRHKANFDGDGGYFCEVGTTARAVAIDEAGKYYLAGTVLAEDGEHLFVAAFD
ncbi:hypothetical protein [Nannocystis exedens]|nr:hypothetical protein [Nannocystis exedens]